MTHREAKRVFKILATILESCGDNLSKAAAVAYVVHATLTLNAAAEAKRPVEEVLDDGVTYLGLVADECRAWGTELGYNFASDDDYTDVLKNFNPTTTH